MHRLNFEQKWQFSTHFAKTRFCAWIFINATNQAAVTAQAVWEAPIPKMHNDHIFLLRNLLCTDTGLAKSLEQQK